MSPLASDTRGRFPECCSENRVKRLKAPYSASRPQILDCSSPHWLMVARGAPPKKRAKPRHLSQCCWNPGDPGNPGGRRRPGCAFPKPPGRNQFHRPRQFGVLLNSFALREGPNPHGVAPTGTGPPLQASNCRKSDPPLLVHASSGACHATLTSRRLRAHAALPKRTKRAPPQREIGRDGHWFS